MFTRVNILQSSSASFGSKHRQIMSHAHGWFPVYLKSKSVNAAHAHNSSDDTEDSTIWDGFICSKKEDYFTIESEMRTSRNMYSQIRFLAEHRDL